MIATIVIRDNHGKEQELLGTTIDIDKKGVLTIYNEEFTAKTTTIINERFLSGPKTTTSTEITRKKYISAAYPSGYWVAVYSKFSKIEPKVTNEPYN